MRHKVKSSLEKLKWYFTNLPVVSTILFIVLVICYKIRLERRFSDVQLCVQPHMVMTGQVSRLIRYVIHHKNVNHLVLSLGSLAFFGSVVERQTGSIRYLFLMALFAVLSAMLTVFLSIVLGFSSRYSSLMYRCPALGLMPALFSITVVLFQNLPLKKTTIAFCIIPNVAIPWAMLIFFQFILQDMTFISNLSGCIVGWLYDRYLWNIVNLPSSAVLIADGVLEKIFRYIPLLKYIPGASPQLPAYHSDSVQSKRGVNAFQPVGVPDDCPVPIAENSVSSHKLEKLVQMGFSKEDSIVSLTASSNNIDQAVSILTSNLVGPQASVLPAS